MKYKIRKTLFGQYEVYFLKDYGNGYSREHIATYPTRIEAEKEQERLNGKEQKTVDNTTHDLIKELHEADAAAAEIILARLHSEQQTNKALYEDEHGEPTAAGMILCGLIETVCVHGVFKRKGVNLNANE